MFPTRKFTAATLAAAIAAVPASFVAAQEAKTETDTQVQTQVETGQSAEAGVEAETGVTADTETAQGETGTAAETGTASDTGVAAETAQSGETETPVFEEAQIEAFASAVVEVTEIRDEYASQLEGVEDKAKQEALIEEANTEMRAAIEETEGLTFDDYMAINRAASMDEELNQKIAQRLEELQTEDAG